jgi:FkbM family methyltransferase
MAQTLAMRARQMLAPRRMLQSWVRAWPEGAKAALARAIAEDKAFVRKRGHRIIAAMAPECGIDSLRVVGEYGPIVSSSRDASVFLKYAQTGRWAESTNAIIAAFFDANGSKGVYLDIGANIGLTTIPIARRPAVTCYAFEPEPENFRNLSINVAANCLHANVKLLQSAVFDRESVLEFELAPNNLGDHRIRLGDGEKGLQGEDQRQTIQVPAAPLDAMVGEIEGPLAIKIDTQGAEPFVVAGGRRTLAAADLLIMEWSPYLMARMGGDPRIVLDMLRQTFPSGRISDAESGEPGKVRPMAEICDHLESTCVSDRARPDRYVDVIATRAPA